MIAADHGDAVVHALLAKRFPGHPLGRPVAGTAHEITALSVESVAAAHQEVTGDQPLAMIAVGPKAVPAWGGNGTTAFRTAWSEPSPAPLPPVSTGTPRWTDELSWLCAGGRAAPIGCEPRHNLMVLSQLLGGSPSSLPYRGLRPERCLAYAFESWSSHHTETGACRVWAGVEGANSDDAVTVIRSVLDILDRLADAGPTDEDLDAARRRAQMRVVLDTESSLTHARALARALAAGRPMWTPQQQEAAALRAVSAGDVRAAASVPEDFLMVVRPEA